MWLDRDRRVLWHPFTRTEEWFHEDAPVIERGRGVYLYDLRGRRYIDGVSSLWCNVHGHRVPEIDRAIRRQLTRVAHSTFLGLTHRPGIELAEELIRIAPAGLSRVFFSDSGAEAVEVAIKVAQRYWQLVPGKNAGKRRWFVSFQQAYHGDTVGAASLGGIDLLRRPHEPLLFRTIRVPSPYSYRCPKRHSLAACGDESLDRVERLLRRRGDEIAAVVLEPCVQGAAGMIVQPPGFVGGIRELTRRHGVLLIADEVATGFGRTGRMFACEHDGVSPDLMALGKGITGGYLPLAATLVTEEIFRRFRGSAERTFFYGHTYTANPLACAAALASLQRFRRRRVLDHARSLRPAFEEGLRRIAEHPNVGEVRSIGLMAGIELVRHRETREPFPEPWRMGRRVILEARRRGVIVRPLGDVVVLMPPLAIRRSDLKVLLRVTEEAIRSACRGR